MNKFNFPKSNYIHTPEHIPVMYVGRVVSIDDKSDAGRIMVNIKGFDDNKNNDNEILEAFPLLPKMVNVFPKVEESVFIFTQYLNERTHRYWIGPIISQPQNLANDKHFLTAKSALMEGSNIALGEAPSALPEANGIYPDKKFVSIQGRNNTDIIHKDAELLLRAGKFVKNEPLIYNKESQGFIQIKSFMDFNESDKDNKNNVNQPDIGSVVNIVGNKINIISHNGDVFYNTMEPDPEKQEDVIRDIIKTAHPLVFGDKLLTILNIFRKFMLTHVHQINNAPIASQPIYAEVRDLELDKILSENIKIN